MAFNFKVKNFNLKSYGKIFKAEYDADGIFDNEILVEKFKKIHLTDTNVNVTFNDEKFRLNLDGKYSSNNN